LSPIRSPINVTLPPALVAIAIHHLSMEKSHQNLLWPLWRLIVPLDPGLHPPMILFFGLSSLVCKVNGIPLCTLSFDMKSYRTLYKLTMQSLDHDSKLFENGITNSMFSKNHCVIVLDLSGTQDMSIVRTGNVRLEWTFVDTLTESITLLSLSQFETYGEITTDGSVL
jgi:hypothetical protein